MLGIKKRYWILAATIGMFALSFVPAISPVRPFIQLPGEVYIGTAPAEDSFLAGLFPGWTNTFTATLVAWALVLIWALWMRAGSRSADEVPTGGYNFFEMVIEGAYNFAENIAGSKVKDFFPFFMTYILIILTSNWLGLVPGVDSIGMWEYKPHFKAEKEIKVIKADLKEAAANGELAILEESLVDQYGVPLEIDSKGVMSSESKEELLHAIEEKKDKLNEGDLKNGMLLQRAFPDADGDKPDDADWTIVPFLRPAATDLNMTLAFAIIAMVAVQYYGIKYLGARDYFSKFFPFIGKGWGAQVAKNPIKAIDPVVGLLELISEISKVISFAFRLLGNIFAGMVLLFVMAFLLPAANLAFFGLEFFVGLIQALVFGLLMLIFMVSATEHHGDHGHDDHH